MIRSLTLSQLARYLPESLAPELLNGDPTFDQLSTDTRSVSEGQLFVALRGERFDAHDFLSEAAGRGVCGLVVEKANPELKVPQLVVHDTLAALGHIGALNREHFTGTVLAITGSSGKTTVKTMAAAILDQSGNTLATRGNFNNQIGVPLTLLEIDARHRYAVIEMGASALGDIAYLCGLARPNVAMVNNVMPAHMAGFGSLEAIARAKGEIYNGLEPDGIGVINFDDSFAPRWRAQMAGREVLGFSLFEPGADCRARQVEYDTESLSFILVTPSGEVPVRLRAPGEHNLRNALAAATCALAAGASLEHIQQGLQAFVPVAGRLSRRTGYGGALIIDDSYNANPGSVKAAINVLAQYEPRRLLVLGDMAELGEGAAEAHIEVGRYARDKGVEQLFTLGSLSAMAAEEFGPAAQSCQTHEQLLEALKTTVDSNTKVLIKGSRSAKMDLVVRGLSDSGEQY